MACVAPLRYNQQTISLSSAMGQRLDCAVMLAGTQNKEVRIADVSPIGFGNILPPLPPFHNECCRKSPNCIIRILCSRYYKAPALPKMYGIQEIDIIYKQFKLLYIMHLSEFESNAMLIE